MSRVIFSATVLLSLLAFAGGAPADLDPVLAQKAADYQSFLEEWHSRGPGGVSEMEFTDATRTEVACHVGIGDSCIWTGMYLGTQSMRYAVTGDPEARAEIIRIAGYLHNLSMITETPGYVARYYGPDESPFNCGMPDGHSWKNDGTGDFDGMFWIDHTSRDQYIGWFWGLTWAHDVLAGDNAADAVEAKTNIENDFRAVIQMLLDNGWNIRDQNGEYTGNGAAYVLPFTRLSWILQAAHVTGDAALWDLLDQQYNQNRLYYWIDTFSLFNKYSEYFGFNLGHLTAQSVFRLWPDRERAEYLFGIWKTNIRTWTEWTHNAWFDGVYGGACARLRICDGAEIDAVGDDVDLSLSQYWEPPNWHREVVCSDLPLDPFSVWADEFLAGVPWLEDLWDINPQTEDAHAVNDRCWSDMLWQRSPYHISCAVGSDESNTGPGVDWLVAYWMGVYYGLLPGEGPYGDDDLIAADDDTGDDDTGDDDTDDDTGDDDTTDDDTSDDDSDDDTDDDSADDDTSETDIPAYGDDDDDDDGGCCG